jgi:hypothetical protein
MCFFARKIKGRFITKIRIGKERGVKKEIKSESPVTPPSISWLGMRKLSKPNAVRRIPKIIKNISFIRLNILKPLLFLPGILLIIILHF